MAIFKPGDMIDDRSLNLSEDELPDRLGHAALAAQAAELAMTSPGYVNIAIFGPWGAGKSSLFELMKRAFEEAKNDEAIPSRQVEFVLFDAWKYAGTDFSVNFLSAMAKKKSAKEKASISRRLFDTRRTLSLPFGLSTLPAWARIALFAVLVFVALGAVPALWTAHLNDWDWSTVSFDSYLDSLKNWVGFGVSGTLVLLLGAIGVDLTRVSVEQSAPSHIAQFGELFDDLVGKKRFVVFVDELDRCSPDQLLQTLEGMRTFLGHEHVVFVAAFDRDAVAATVANERKKGQRVSTAADAAYYLTAGEYLDKIFQYQLSLPPQSAQTIRKFAIATVRGRKGIWRDLANRGDLEMVVSLLSPSHVRSPRRTKVLLNDFVVNARDHEQLVGDDWIERAREIAVWTVLQTEFPSLAAQMVSEPDLPDYLVDFSIEPSRSSFAALVKEYREPSTELDSARDAGVQRKLHNELTFYLERVRSLGIPFPAADLIWRTKSSASTNFEDQGLPRVLARAADAPARLTVEALKGASGADLLLAVDFLAQEIEQEFVAESSALSRVIGELAGEHSQVRDNRASLVQNVWRRASAHGARWVDRKSASGFGQVLAVADTPAGVTTFLRLVLDDARDAAGTATVAVIRSLPETRWDKTVEALGAIAVQIADTDLGPLFELVAREDRAESGWLTDAEAARVVKALTVPDPIPVVADRITLNVAEAAAANTAAEEEVANHRASIANNLNQIATLWPRLLESGPSRGWLLLLLRKAVATYPDLGTLHDELISRTDVDQTAEGNAVLALRSIKDSPAESLGRWVPSGGPVLAPADVRGPIDELIRLVVARPARGGEVIPQMVAVAAVFGTNSLGENVSVPLGNLDTSLGAIAIWDGLLALDILAQDFADEAARVLWLAKMVEVLQQTSAVTLPDHLQLISESSYPLLKALDRDLRDGADPSDTDAAIASLVAVLLEIDSHRRSNSERSISIPLGLIRKAAADATWPDLLNDWLRSGPPFSQVIELIPTATISRVPAPVWHEYSKASGVRSSTSAWKTLRAASASLAVLRSIAMSGVESSVYADVASELVSGASDSERSSAFEAFMSLPQSTRSAAAAAAAIAVGLAGVPGGARSGDYRYVADVLVANSAKLTASEKAVSRTALRAFRVPVLGQARRKELVRQSGLA